MEDEISRECFIGLLIKLALGDREVDIDNKKLSYIFAGIDEPSNEDLVKILKAIVHE